MSAMISTIEASFFLIKTNLGLSPKIIVELSIPHFDYQEETLRSLTKQTVNTRVGLFLLLLSFILQMGNALWPLRYRDFGVDWLGVLASIVFCVFALVISYYYSSHKSKKLLEQCTQIMRQRHSPKEQHNTV
jgi:hypothetical protein